DRHVTCSFQKTWMDVGNPGAPGRAPTNGVRSPAVPPAPSARGGPAPAACQGEGGQGEGGQQQAGRLGVVVGPDLHADAAGPARGAHRHLAYRDPVKVMPQVQDPGGRRGEADAQVGAGPGQAVLTPLAVRAGAALKVVRLTGTREVDPASSMLPG